MSRWEEPSLQGNKKAAKDKRKELFRLVYRFLEGGDVVAASDEENIGCRWRRVRSQYVGSVVPPSSRGQFRRRIKGFVPLEQISGSHAKESQ